MSEPTVVIVLVDQLPKPPRSKLDKVLNVASAVVCLAMVLIPAPRRL